jgi:hypothetical protein
MRYKKAPAIRVRAAEVLLDRGWGKAPASVDIAMQDQREPMDEPANLTPPQVALALGKLLTKAEAEMGIDPATGLTDAQRIRRILASGKHLHPDLYQAIQETKH